MPPETTDQTLRVIDASLPSPRLNSSSNGLPDGRGFTVPARAKLLRGELAFQNIAGKVHIAVERAVAEQVTNGDLVAAPDNCGRPAEAYEVLERAPWSSDSASPRSHLVRLITKPAQDKRTIADDMAERNRKAREYHERERKGEEERRAAARHRQQLELVAVLEEMGIEAAVNALGDEQRASLLVELERKREAAAGDQRDAA